jgi:hypothetical protein
VITEIEGASEHPSGIRPWLLPAVLAALCAVAIAGAATAAPEAEDRAEERPLTQSVIAAARAVVPRATQPPALTFPRNVAALVATSPFSTATGLISAAEIEHAGGRFTYRLADGRSVVLLQFPAELAAPALVGGPALSGPARVRGQTAQATSGEGSSSVSWIEGSIRYALFSTRVPIDELIGLANALR